MAAYEQEQAGNSGKRGGYRMPLQVPYR